MLRQHSILHAWLRRYCGPVALATAALLLVGNAAWADDKGNKGNEAGDDRAVAKSVTNRQWPPVVTPLGPGEAEGGAAPAKGGVALSCVTVPGLAASRISTALLERSAR